MDNTNAAVKKGKRTRSPAEGGDEATPHKMTKYMDYLANISSSQNSSAGSLTPLESCEKRTDESSESLSTPRVRPKSTGTRRVAGHANSVLDLQHILQKNYSMLKKKLEPTELADRLYDKGILDTKALQNIKKGGDRRNKNDILLKELCRGNQGNRENIGYGLFILSLKETRQDSLADELASIQGPDEVHDLQLLNERHDMQTFVKEMKETLLEEVEPMVFLDDIVGNGGLSMKEHEEINKKPKRQQRIEFLIEKVKSAKDSVAIKIVKPMADAYPDLYKAFKNGRKGNKNCQQQEAVKEEYLVPVGSPLQVKVQLTVGNTVPVQDTNAHTDPVNEIRKKRREAEEIERRIVNNANENKDQLNELLENCIAELKLVKFSCIKIYLKSLSKESLGQLVTYSRSGAAKRWLLSLIDEETKQKLLDMNAKIVLEISKGCEDGVVKARFEKECICHLNKETVACNFTALKEGMRGSRTVIKRFLQSRVLDDKSRLYLKQIQTAKKIKERNARLLQFLLQKDLPDVFFCILEDEIIKHDGADIIRSTIKSADLTDNEILTKEDIRNNKKMLAEELETQWFIRRLEVKRDPRAFYLASMSRDQRINQFLHYLLRENDLSWFTKELKMKNKHLFDILTSRKASNMSIAFRGLDFGRIQTATHLFFDDIIEEVDPWPLTKRLGKRAQRELHSFKLKTIPKRSIRASQFCLSLLGVSPSTLYDALHTLASCGYKEIVDNITALAREGPINSRYKCPKILYLDQCKETVLSKTTFTLEGNSKEDAGLSSTSAGRSMKILTYTITDDNDYSDTDDFNSMLSGNSQSSSVNVDKLRHDVFSPVKIKCSRKSAVQSVKGESESGIFSGSGTRTETEGFNTDEDSDYEKRVSEVDKRKITTEWIVSHSNSESFGIPPTTVAMHMNKTKSHLPVGKDLSKS